MHFAQTQPPAQSPFLDVGMTIIGALLFLAVTGFFFWKDFKKTRWLYKIWLAATESNVGVVAVLWIFVVWWLMPLTYALWAVTLPLKGLIMVIKYRQLRGTFVKGALKRKTMDVAQPPLMVAPQTTLMTPDGEIPIEGAPVAVPQPPKQRIYLSSGLTQMVDTPTRDTDAVGDFFLANYETRDLTAYEYVGMGRAKGGYRVDIILKSNGRVQFSAIASNGMVVEILKAVPRKKAPQPPLLPPGQS